jgi:ATP-dependent HslUV protease subunit HslV
VLDPDGDAYAIGSGGQYALAAARALCENSDLDARDIAEKAMHIAADICAFTNHNIIFEELEAA